ncbi:MAG: response regulator transcription factor [Candidatus Methylomirabilales bacterium]
MTKKLLIADDEAGVRSLVRMTLESESLEILEASTGHEAIELARSESPDLILLDVMMPGLSGFDVCRALKGDRATAGIPVVILTARAQASDLEDGEAAGADDYFTKPFSPVALMRKVDEILAPEEA